MAGWSSSWISWIRWMIWIVRLRWKGRGKSHSFLFSTFFTFLGNPPLKSSNPKCIRYTHPPTMNITPLCSPLDTLPGGVNFIGIGWVRLKWLVTMDTKNYLPHHFKAILRPLQPISQDKTHITMLPRRCRSRPDKYRGHWSRFPN